MGCANSSMDANIKTLASGINSSIQVKSVLQYQINQLKNIVEQKKAFPDMAEVKESQLESILLSKEIKDTENLLSSIKGSQDENIIVLEETVFRLQSILSDQEAFSQTLVDEINCQEENIKNLQEKLAQVSDINQQLSLEISQFQDMEKSKLGYILDL